MYRPERTSMQTCSMETLRWAESALLSAATKCGVRRTRAVKFAWIGGTILSVDQNGLRRLCRYQGQYDASVGNGTLCEFPCVANDINYVTPGVRFELDRDQNVVGARRSRVARHRAASVRLAGQFRPGAHLLISSAESSRVRQSPARAFVSRWRTKAAHSLQRRTRNPSPRRPGHR